MDFNTIKENTFSEKYDFSKLIKRLKVTTNFEEDMPSPGIIVRHIKKGWLALDEDRTPIFAKYPDEFVNSESAHKAAEQLDAKDANWSFETAKYFSSLINRLNAINFCMPTPGTIVRHNKYGWLALDNNLRPVFAKYPERFINSEYAYKSAETLDPDMQNWSFESTKHFSFEEMSFICDECKEESTTLYTIREWCDEKGITDEEDIEYLEWMADKQNMTTDICEDCFDALYASSGL